MKKAKNFIRAIQAFMDSARGKTVLNYLYSWGAAIVILGTLFKLTHIAGANLMLFVGMGTEVLVFFFSAFERPYEVAEEEKREEIAEEAMAMGQPVIINGPIMAGGYAPAQEGCTAMPPAATGDAVTASYEGTAIPQATGNGIQATAGINVPSIGNIDEMDKVTEEYVEQVRALNEAIQRIAEQSEALGRNMQEMETLGRNLTGMNALYEVQLRGASGQLNSIDKVNEQTKKMAEQVEELNALYARMIEAMTTNMNRPQI
jgi:gliding motility-associated protein GldL